MMRLNWTDFKKFIDDKEITFQWFDKDTQYEMFASDGLLSFFCVLDKNPSDTTFLDDFTNNYKDYQNIPASMTVTPTCPKNVFQLNPQGLHARRFNPSDYLGSITLSNKNGSTYDYTKTLAADLIKEDCIWLWDADGYLQRHYIESFTSTTLTLACDDLAEGTYNLSRKFAINYSLDGSVNINYLWGVMLDVVGTLGRYDWDVLEVIDPDTGEEIKRYDEVWTAHINNLVRVMTPDGSPGPLPSVILRIDHYHADDDFVGNIVRADYITTIKD